MLPSLTQSGIRALLVLNDPWIAWLMMLTWVQFGAEKTCATRHDAITSIKRFIFLAVLLRYSRMTDNARTTNPILIHFFLSLFQEIRAEKKTLVHDTWVWERWVICLCQSPGLGLIYFKLITKLYLFKQRAFVCYCATTPFLKGFQSRPKVFCFVSLIMWKHVDNSFSSFLSFPKKTKMIST